MQGESHVLRIVGLLIEEGNKNNNDISSIIFIFIPNEDSIQFIAMLIFLRTKKQD